MRILTLNLNGIRSATAKGVVSWLAESNADVICLQEVRAFPEQVPPEWQTLGYHAHWYPAEKPGYSGVAVLSKTKPKRVTLGRVASGFQGRQRRFNLYAIGHQQPGTAGHQAEVYGRVHATLPAFAQKQTRHGVLRGFQYRASAD